MRGWPVLSDIMFVDFSRDLCGVDALLILFFRPDFSHVSAFAPKSRLAVTIGAV